MLSAGRREQTARLPEPVNQNCARHTFDLEGGERAIAIRVHRGTNPVPLEALNYPRSNGLSQSRLIPRLYLIITRYLVIYFADEIFRRRFQNEFFSIVTSQVRRRDLLASAVSTVIADVGSREHQETFLREITVV